MKFGRRMAVAEQHVVRALREHRSELAGLVKGLEQELSEHRAALMHLDATMRLFDPEIRPEEIGSAQRRRCNAWFCPGECLRLIYDVLRDAPQPVTTREIADRVIPDPADRLSRMDRPPLGALDHRDADQPDPVSIATTSAPLAAGMCLSAPDSTR